MKVNVNINTLTNVNVPIRGHVYQHENGSFFICDYANRLVGLEAGGHWANTNGFGDSAHKFTDVTHLVQVTNI